MAITLCLGQPKHILFIEDSTRIVILDKDESFYVGDGLDAQSILRIIKQFKRKKVKIIQKRFFCKPKEISIYKIEIIPSEILQQMIYPIYLCKRGMKDQVIVDNNKSFDVHYEIGRNDLVKFFYLPKDISDYKLKFSIKITPL